MIHRQPAPESLAQTALKMVRLNMQTSAAETTPQDLVLADSLFKALQSSDGASCIRTYVSTGASDCGIETFLGMVRELDDPSSTDDPAAAATEVLRELPEVADSVRPLLDGYAAALQLNMDETLEISSRLRLIEFMLTLGCPVTYRDLGLDESDTLKLQELAKSMAGVSAPAPYGSEAFDFFIAMRRLDDVGSRFSGQKKAPDLARKVMENPGFEELKTGLSGLAPLKVAFLGDSQTDNRHWSSPAHYPAIIEAVLAEVNPAIKVINAGVGGDDSGEALARLEQDVLSHSPNVCFILLGGNDCMFWGGERSTVSPEKFRENIAETTARLKKIDCRVVLMNYPHIPILDERERATIDAMNSHLTSLRDSLDTGWLPLGEVLDKGEPRRMYAPDMIHLAPEAHGIITLEILNYLAGGKER